MPAATRLLEPKADLPPLAEAPAKRAKGDRRVTAEGLALAPKKKERRRRTERRGPLRPDRLAPARARIDGHMAERALRLADGVILGVMATAAFGVLSGTSLLSAPLATAAPLIGGVIVLVWSLKAAGAYRFSARERLAGHMLRVTAAVAPAAVALGAVLFAGGAWRQASVPSRIWLAMLFAAPYLAHAGWWAMVARWRGQGRLTPNIVVVGATRNAERLITSLIDTREAHVLGVFDDRLDRVPENLCGVPVLGATDALLGHRITPFVDRIVLTVPAAAQGRVRQIIERLRVLPNEISLYLDFDSEAADAAIDRLASAPLAQMSGVRRDGRRAFWKRAQDLAFSALGLLAAAPAMAAIAVAIRLDSPGPVFFRQRRHGFNNEEITVWKFRSMRVEAADATAERQVSAGDDRVTRVGRFIRATSLDELPQIFNVLMGEMSLVGPRPHAIGMKTGEVESARLVAEYAHRHRLKPGMTGWAAIHGSRGPVDTPEAVRRRVALDVEYIERQSFWLDLYIMAVTVPCLLGDRDAVR
jgi:Undecaprenyl-phosphate glucose phosphotransferase